MKPRKHVYTCPGVVELKKRGKKHTWGSRHVMSRAPATTSVLWCDGGGGGDVARSLVNGIIGMCLLSVVLVVVMTWQSPTTLALSGIVVVWWWWWWSLSWSVGSNMVVVRVSGHHPVTTCDHSRDHSRPLYICLVWYLLLSCLPSLPDAEALPYCD